MKKMIWVTENEAKLLHELMNETGKSASQLFREGLHKLKQDTTNETEVNK